MTTNEKRLMEIEELVARKVNNVNCYLTREDVSALESARKACGKSWDAINHSWQTLEEVE
jgi:hemerythrin-like domain-containing protein